MAELFASAIVRTLVQNLTSASLREIGLLWGLNDELDDLQSTLTAIQCAVEDAEMQQRKSASLQNWLRNLKRAANDVENVLDRMETELLSGRLDFERGKSFLSLMNPSQLRFRFKMVKRVKNVRKRLLSIADERRNFPLREGVVESRFGVTLESRETGSLVIESEIYGRQAEKETIVAELLHNDRNRDVLSVLAICGMGGLGKTTLAQLVYNDERTQKHFDLRMWVCVSDDFDVQKLARRIIECVDESTCNISELDLLQRHLQERLMGKKFLLVLDDVWNENHRLWDGLREILNCDSKGSVLLVTTRTHNVATMIGAIYVHHIGCLAEEDSWSLFKQRAFSAGKVDENLVPIGKMILKKCRGVPLAIKALGSMMRSKSNESEWLAVQESEIWDLLGDENGVTPVLRLSYYNLQPHLRQCFAYCCIFPKDYEMEEDRLIQLWMANGFISSTGQIDLHDNGQSIFKELVWRSFFQDIKKNEKGNTTCKMHDLMHDLASSVMGDETYVVERGKELKIPKAPLHLCFAPRTIGYGKEYSEIKLPNDDSLRSLIMLGVCDVDFCFVLSRQQFIRALDLDLTYYFPKSLSNLFCKLKHLKHLAMSCSDIKRLPNSLTCLYNLQTLKLTDSWKLLELPKDLRVMKNLWFLEIENSDSLVCMPPELGELTCLCRLSIFIVGLDTSQQIHQLKELNLGGELCIKGLNNVSNLEDAKSANLITKKNLTSLTLLWAKEQKNKPVEHFDEVLEGLRPHHNLEKIFIEWYPGSKFSNWMSSIAFTNLKEISLKKCQRCVHLPPLGKLPSLTHLLLEDLVFVKHLGAEWLGDGECSFPALTILQISNMDNLEEWSIPDSMKSFPCLTKLSIKWCPKLNRLPPLGKLPSLTDLDMEGINSVKHLGAAWVGDGECSFPALTILQIINMDNLEEWSIPDSMKSFPCLTKLSIEGCPKLNRLPSFVSIMDLSIKKSNMALLTTIPILTSLKSLSLSDLIEVEGDLLQNNRALQYLEIGSTVLKNVPIMFVNLSTLKTLHLDHCFDLESFPEDFSSVRTLESMQIMNCDNLRTFPVAILDDLPSLISLGFRFCEKLKPLSGTLKQSSLRQLDIQELPELQCLPESMQQLTSLRELAIWYCHELCFLPDWFGNLGLSRLHIWYCKKLKSLPDSFSSLKSLRRLIIWECPKLEKRCKKPDGKDWSKISHIPYIDLNNEVIQELD